MKRWCWTLLLFTALSGCSNDPVLLPQASARPSPAPEPEIYITSLTATGSGFYDFNASLNVFAKGAAGNVAPLEHRAYSDPGDSGPFAAAANGDYWQLDPARNADQATQACMYPAGVSRHSISGAVIQQILEPPCTAVVSATTDRQGNVFVAYGSNIIANEFGEQPCDVPGAAIQINEFSPTATGQPPPLKSINIPSAYAACSLYSLAVTSAGNIWLSGRLIEGPINFILPPIVPILYEIDPTATSAVAPLHSLPIDATAQLGSVAVDAGDDLYYLSNGAVYRTLPDGTHPVIAIPGPSVKAFTLGDGGYIIAEVATGAGAAIEEFAPGQTVAKRIIAGSKTTLDPPRFNTAYIFITAVP